MDAATEETQTRQAGCPLCQPASEIVLHADDRLRIIQVVGEPGLPAYFRVIWQAHRAEMSDLGDEDRRYLWEVLHLVETGMRRHFSPDKINLASFGNQVPHLHWHLIGRWRSDPQFPGSPWSPVLREEDTGQQENARRVSAGMSAFREWLSAGLAQSVARQR